MSILILQGRRGWLAIDRALKSLQVDFEPIDDSDVVLPVFKPA